MENYEEKFKNQKVKENVVNKETGIMVADELNTDDDNNKLIVEELKNVLMRLDDKVHNYKNPCNVEQEQINVQSPFCRAILVIYLKEDTMDRNKIIQLYQTFRVTHSTKFKELFDGMNMLWVRLFM